MQENSSDNHNMNDNYPPKKNRQTSPPVITREVVEALRAGDHNAYAKVFLYYQSPLENFILKLTGSREDAEELFQEVFIDLWEKRAKIDPSKNIKSYLYTIAKNAALNHNRAKGKFNGLITGYEFTVVEDVIAADSEIITRETQLLLEIAVGNMPHLRSEIYKMYLDGLSYDEIADKIGISKGNVQRQISNARKDVSELIYLITFFMIQ